MFFYIKEIETKATIEVFRKSTKREELLLLSSYYVDDKMIVVSKEKLKEIINNLIELRRFEKEIDKGDWIFEDSIYSYILYEGYNYKLETSGFDNLLIFAMRIFNHPKSEFLIESN